MLYQIQNQSLTETEENQKLRTFSLLKFMSVHNISQADFISEYPHAWRQVVAEELGNGYTADSGMVHNLANNYSITRSTTKYKLNTTTPEYAGKWFQYHEKPAILRTIKNLRPQIEVFAGDIDFFQCDPTGTGYGSTKVYSKDIGQAASVLSMLIDEACEFQNEIDRIAAGEKVKHPQEVYNLFENLGKISREFARRLATDPDTEIILGKARDHYAALFGQLKP